MNTNHERREWAERLETGQEDDELLALAARLRRAGDETRPAPPLAFQQQLRRDLLKQYEASPRRSAGLWRWAGSAAALGLLALAVVTVWLAVGSAGRLSFGGDVAQPITPQIAATAQIVQSPPANAAYLEAYSTGYGNSGVESSGPFPGGTLQVHVRWRVPAGFTAVRTFAHLRDAAGQTVAQADMPLEGSGETREALLTLALPFSLPPGDYEVVSGLTDAAGAPQTVYEFDNAALAVEASLGVIAVVAPEEADNTVSASEYTYLDYSITGGLVLESVQTDGGDFQTRGMMLPGVKVGVVTRWSLPLATAAVVPFVHLLDSEGRIMAQADGGTLTDAERAGQPVVEATLSLTPPADLPAGDYELVAGLYDAVTGERHTISTPQGEVTVVPLDRYPVMVPDATKLEQLRAFLEQLEYGELDARIAEAQEDMLLVTDVSPPAGTVITGTAPVEFAITVDFAIRSVPSAVLEMRIVDVEGENGRGVGLATVDSLFQGTGKTTVVVVVDPMAELSGPTDLGLWLQLKPDAASAPILIEMPEAFRWRYEP